MSYKIMELVEKDVFKEFVLEFEIGDFVDVYIKIFEGEKECI